MKVDAGDAKNKHTPFTSIPMYSHAGLILGVVDEQRLDNLVTLTTEESHLKLHTWKGGDLGLHFKTHHDHALLLMQTSSDTEFGNKFTIKIVSGEGVHEFGSVC